MSTGLDTRHPLYQALVFTSATTASVAIRAYAEGGLEVYERSGEAALLTYLADVADSTLASLTGAGLWATLLLATYVPPVTELTGQPS